MTNFLRTTVLAAWATAVTATASAMLTGPGDLAFVGYDSDFNRLSVLSLVDIPAASTVFFSDIAWDGASFPSSSLEGTLQWSTGGSLIPAGTVIDFTDVGLLSQTAEFGTLAEIDVSFNPAGSDETIWAFVGSPASPTFLAAIANEDDPPAGPNLSGTGLTAGTTAQLIDGDFDVLNYIGPTAGEAAFADYLPHIGDVSNWERLANGTYAPPAAFSVVAIPEPTAALFGGLVAGGLGVAVSRRSGR